MGVIYDFNQQIIPTDNDYDVVKVVPTGFVLYRENMPSFAFFPGQFVGVKNGIKVNDPESNWKLLEIDSYFAQFGNRRDVIENLPEEFKEVLRKLVTQAAKMSYDRQVDKDTSPEVEENKTDKNIYKIFDKFNSERMNYSSLEEFQEILVKLNDPEKIALQLLPAIFYGLNEVCSSDLYFYGEEVEEMTLEKFIMVLKTSGLDSVRELIEEITNTQGEFAVPYELHEAEEFITSINKFPILEFLRENLDSEEYKAIISLKVKDAASAFLHGFSDKEKSLLKKILSRKFVEMASISLSQKSQENKSLDRFIDLVVNNVYLNLADKGKIGEKFIEDENSDDPNRNSINLLFALADVIHSVLKDISSTEIFLDQLNRHVLSDPEIIELEKKISFGGSSKELLEKEVLNFLREFEKLKNVNLDTSKLIKLSTTLASFAAKILILSGNKSSKFSSFIDEAKKYISNSTEQNKEYDKLESLIQRNYLKILFNKNLKKLFGDLLESDQNSPQNKSEPFISEISISENSLDSVPLKILEQLFLDKDKLYRNKLYDFVALENLDTKLESFILTKDFTSAIEATTTIRNTEVPAYLAVFVASIDPRLVNSLSDKENLKKHDYFKGLLKQLENIKAHNLSEEEESLYIRCLSLAAKDFTEISEDELNSFINSINRYIEDEETLHSAINIINNVFKVASFMFGRGENYFKRHQSEIFFLHDKIIENLEVEKVLKLSDEAVSDDYIFNFKQQLRNLNQRGVNYVRSDPVPLNILRNYMNSIQTSAKALKDVSPDAYEEFIKTFIKEFSLYGDHAFLTGIQKLNKILTSTFKNLRNKSVSDVDSFLKLSQTIILGEILLAETIPPFKQKNLYTSISPNLIERESPGTFFSIVTMQHNLNSLFKELESIFYEIKNKHPDKSDEAKKLFLATSILRDNSSSLKHLKLNVTAPAPSEQDKFEGKVYFFDIMTRDPKDFPKIFSNHGTQVLYHNILNPFNTSLSRQQVFNSLTYQWNDINYVPLLYRRCEKEIYGDTGVRRPKINLASLDSIFEQDNILNQATIQDISISINPGSEEFYNKEIKSIDIKYEIGDEEIYFQIPVGVYTTFSGFMEYLFNAAYLSNDVSDDTLAKMYIILNIINQVKQKGDSKHLQALLSGDKLAEHTKKILQELQTTKTGKRILDKALYKYLSLAGGYFYGKKGQQERVLVDVHDEGAPETIIPFLFSKPIQDLGRKTSRAFLDILGKVPDVFRNILSIPSAIRLLYTPPNSEYSGVLGFTINKPFLFSSRNTFLHRVANTDDRTSPITLVAGESSNIGLFSDVLRASGERFFDYDLFMYGGKSDPQNIYTNEENGGLIKDLSDEKLRYSSYHENKSPMATALHEIGHTIYYELPFHSKKRMFELYRRKYIGELDTTLQKFYDKLPDSTKSLVENSLMNAKLIASEIMTLNVTEKEFENLLYELKNALMFTSDTVYSHLSRDSTLQDEFNQFTTELREKYMAPYALTTFYELSSVAFDAYMYNREEFVRKFPEEYKYVILPMLEYIYNNKGIDLTVDGAWGKKIQEADFQKILT